MYIHCYCTCACIIIHAHVQLQYSNNVYTCTCTYVSTSSICISHSVPLYIWCVFDVYDICVFRMSEWHMNTFLYAPKDDDKHRACWRELYSLEEADKLSHLIHEAASRGVIFIYAIAPGLSLSVCLCVCLSVALF